MKFRHEAQEVHALLEAADEAIPTVEIKADLLRDFLERLRSAEERLKQQLALLREREEPRDTDKAPGGWARLDQIERTARRYMGAEFANIEASVGLFKRLFACVRDGDLEAAERMVNNLDSGADSRPWQD